MYKANLKNEYHIDLKVSTKEDELFDYVGIPSYMKSRKYSEKYKDDYEMRL